jgi:hypothetical protein
MIMNHERKISLRFLGIIFIVLRLEVSVYKMFTCTNLVSTNFCLWEGGGGGGSVVKVTVSSKEDNS